MTDELGPLLLSAVGLFVTGAEEGLVLDVDLVNEDGRFDNWTELLNEALLGRRVLVAETTFDVDNPGGLDVKLGVMVLEGWACRRRNAS